MPREQPTKEEWEIDAKIAESKVRSWKPEVIADSSGEWCGNGLRFPTFDEAVANAKDLMSRWMLVTDYRAVVSEDEPNYRWVEGRLVEIEDSEGEVV